MGDSQSGACSLKFAGLTNRADLIQNLFSAELPVKQSIEAVFQYY